MAIVSYVIKPSDTLRGDIKVPGDKSISHRSIILGAISEGTTHITGFLTGEDSLRTLQAFRSMGIKIERDNDKVVIYGKGLYGLKQPKNALNLGNSGTAMRLIAGLLSAQKFNTTLIGDESLSKRPMMRIIKPLEMMGAKIKSNNGMPPLEIIANNKLKAIKYDMPIASAQVKSAIILAALYAKGESVITEKAVTRNHSEMMLQGFGYDIKVADNKIKIKGGDRLKATQIIVPADISSAAFFMVGATIAKKSQITLKAVNVNPTRTGVIDILKLMGADISVINKTKIAGEEVADICVKSADLKAITIPKKLVPLAIDEFPAIFIAASCAKGRTILRGAKELRVKESDRIQVMADGLAELGIKTEVLDDGIKIYGSQFKKQTKPIDSNHDHRISMAFAMAGLASGYEIQINDCANVKTSFPNFIDLAKQAGLNIKEI